MCHIWVNSVSGLRPFDCILCVEMIYFIVHPITLSLFMIYSYSFLGMHIR